MCPLVRNSECMEKFRILQRDVPSQTLPIMRSLLGAMKISGSGCFIAKCKTCGTEFGRWGDVKERAAKIKTTLGDAMNGTGFKLRLFDRTPAWLVVEIVTGESRHRYRLVTREGAGTRRCIRVRARHLRLPSRVTPWSLHRMAARWHAARELGGEDVGLGHFSKSQLI
jgi:hypothetical protein